MTRTLLACILAATAAGLTFWAVDADDVGPRSLQTTATPPLHEVLADPDWVRARTLLEGLAREGHELAAGWIACRRAEGTCGYTRDFERARAEAAGLRDALHFRAHRGEGEAALLLARMTEVGILGETRSDAVEWYDHESTPTTPIALAHRGHFLLANFASRRREALDLLEASATRECPAALVSLAVACRGNWGVPEDIGRARRLLAAAADAGFAPAAYRIARRREWSEEAITLYRRAAEGGYHEAWSELADRCRQNGDLHRTATVLEDAVRAHPDDAVLRRRLGRLHLWLWKVDLRHGDEESAERRIDRAAELRGEIPEVVIARARFDVGRDRLLDAARRLETCLDLTGNGDVARELGDVLYDMDHLDAAERTWLRAKKLGAGFTSGRLRRVRREITVETGLKSWMTHDFLCKYPADVESTANFFRSVLTHAKREAAELLGTAPKHRVIVVVYPHEELTAIRGRDHWAPAWFDGKIRISVGQWWRTTEQLRRICRHEYLHFVISRLCENCPAWLNEGLAQVFEEDWSAHPRFFESRERSRLPANPFPLAGLQGGFGAMSLPVARGAYAQAHLFTRFLLKRFTWEQIAAALRRTAQRADFCRQMQKLHGSPPMEKLHEEWLATL